jgi:hypothetical protein
LFLGLSGDSLAIDEAMNILEGAWRVGLVILELQPFLKPETLGVTAASWAMDRF